MSAPAQVPKTVTVYLVRHGESLGNTERALLVPTEDVLTDNGKNQAQKLAAHLSNVKFTRAYSSDYSRTLETANIVLGQSKSQLAGDVQPDSRIRERYMGVFEGKKYREVLAEVIKSRVKITDFIVPEGETIAQLDSRATEFLKEVFNKALDSTNPDEIILILSHALFLNRLMHYLQTPAAEQNFLVVGWQDKCKKIMTNTAYMKLDICRATPDDHRIGIKFLEIHEKAHLGGVGNSGNDILMKFIQDNPEGSFLSDCIQA